MVGIVSKYDIARGFPEHIAVLELRQKKGLEILSMVSYRKNLDTGKYLSIFRFNHDTLPADLTQALPQESR